MTLAYEKDHVQPPASIGSANESVGCILPLLPFVAVDLVIVEKALFTFPVSDTMPVDLRQIAVVPLKLDRLKLA
jgi:hypothetical protein